MLKKLFISIICLSLISPFFTFGMFKTSLLRACANSGAFRQTTNKLFRSTIPLLMTRQEACKILRIKGNESESEINKAYKKAVLRIHPDVGGSDELMKLVNEARDVLKKTRQDYQDTKEEENNCKQQDRDYSGRDSYTHEYNEYRRKTDEQAWRDLSELYRKQEYNRYIAGIIIAGIGTSVGMYFISKNINRKKS